jgi:hypothetical protein
MGMIQIKIIFISFLMLASGVVLAQQNEYETAYISGKQFFQSGKFELAMEAFKPALNESPRNSYGPYASFYYAVSAYNSGYKALARDMFLQANEKYPGWDFSDESIYWVSVIHFEEGNVEEGLRYANMVRDDSFESNIEALKTVYLDRIDSLELLKYLYQQYPDDKSIAISILHLIDELPLEEKDFALLEQIAVKQGWDVGGVALPKFSVKKDSYNIAVMFPFIYENMEASGLYLRKTAIIDLYEGIRQGVEYLNENGLKINLHVYDTKGDSLATAEILEKPEMKQVDLIIGPLLTGPSKLANEFSFENQINIVNPVSSNVMVLGNNPYAFLLNPSTITLGKRGGEFAVSTLKNKNTIIVRGPSESDAQMAQAFKEVVELDSFKILANRRVHKDSAELFYNMLTKKQEVLDTLGNVVLDEETELPLEELVIPPDSIGVIFIATFDYKIASEVFSAVAERADSIQIIGHGRWLTDKTANYPYMEKLGIWLLTPNYVDYSRYGYEQFASTYLNKYHALPSQYVLMGYESMLFTGYCLHQFGIYFQNELNNQVIRNVSLYDAYDFRNSHDNQNIPILKFEDLDLVIQNLRQDTGDN